MNTIVLFSTDTATLAVFDPALLASRAAGAGDWWCGQFHRVPEVAAGQIALFGLGGDGVYKVRITTEALTSAELSYATAFIALGIEVESGSIFVGAGECLPGGDSVHLDSTDTTSGTFIAMPSGEYVATGYSVEWDEAPDWFVEEGHPVPASAPADIVLVLSHRAKRFEVPGAGPRFFVNAREWLFPEMPRRLGPVPGMVLSTSVVLRRDDLVLKPCGPASYRPVVEDMSRLQWRDRVQVRVVSVNHDAREFAAEIVGVGAWHPGGAPNSRLS